MNIYLIIFSAILFFLAYLDYRTKHAEWPKSKNIRTLLRTILILIARPFSFFFIYGHQKKFMLEKLPIWPYFMALGVISFILAFIID